jgi:hypothetical protein
MKVSQYILFIFLTVTVICSCKKKENFTYDNRPTSLHFANSSARIVNISDYNQVIANGQKLTNFLPQVQGNVPPVSGTLYFPSTGSFSGKGNAWYIPQNLINADGSANISLNKVSMVGAGAPNDTISPTVFKAVDNFNHPLDYYAIYSGVHSASFPPLTDTVIAIPRSVSAPSDPTHFKIRVLNLIDNGDPSNLKGPLTLTYADGTPVNTVTSGVKQGAYSDYIELPYGSYQFKLQTQNGAQLPCAANSGLESVGITYVDPVTGIMVDGHNNFLNNVIATIQSYEPGGVYTVVASVNGTFVPYINEGAVYINSFRTIADISVPVNLTYARVQAVNVIPGANISLLVDGKSLGSALAFGKATDYQIYVQGDHDIKAVDQNGKVLAEKTLSVKGNDVWTVWAYAANGKTDLSFATDNMSGNYFNNNYGGDVATGVNSITHYAYTPALRFLNFCQDLPYATFTDQNGQPLQQNITPGQILTTSAYTLGIPDQIRVYQSQPSPLIVPGTWLSNITAIQPADFIANKSVYSQGNFTGLPRTEFGIYSVALIGSLNNTGGEGQGAHLVIIKHNK